MADNIMLAEADFEDIKNELTRRGEAFVLMRYWAQNGKFGRGLPDIALKMTEECPASMILGFMEMTKAFILENHNGYVRREEVAEMLEDDEAWGG